MTFKPEDPGVNCLRMEVSLSAAMLTWRMEYGESWKRMEESWEFIRMDEGGSQGFKGEVHCRDADAEARMNARAGERMGSRSMDE
jgi:hypothetical protein